MSVTLNHGALSLGLSPAIGGSVQYFRWAERHLLRPAPTTGREADDVLQSSAFPMVPFTGRIAQGQFQFAGKTVQLPANMPPEPHAIHGSGWQSHWALKTSTTSMAELSFDGGGDAWPWPYTATQRFELSDKGLLIRSTLTNCATTPMPAGFGWHPYFPRQNAHLASPTQTIWPLGPNMAPTKPVPVDAHRDLHRGRIVDELKLDDVFDGGIGPHVIRWPDLTLTMTADPVFAKLVIYVPPGEDYFCVEPVSQAPDAVNSKLPHEVTGLHILDPGKSLSGAIRLTIDPVV